MPQIDVDDVVQETVLGAWHAMTTGRFRPQPDRPLQEALRAWLCGVAWRQMTHHRDHAHRRWEVPTGLGLALATDAGPLPADHVAAGALLAALRSLPQKYRDVLALATVGATIREIAAHLDIPEGTGWTRLRKARQHLRRALAATPRALGPLPVPQGNRHVIPTHP